MHDAVVERDVGAGLDLAVDVRVVGDPLAAGVDHDELRAATARLLEERRRDGVVRGRVRPGEDRDVRVDDIAVGRRHRTGADTLEQRRDARRVAQACAVVDVVRAEARADELLEEVGLLVGALRGAEPGDRPRAALRVDLLELRGGEVQRLLPRGLAEVRQDLVVVDEPARLLPAAAGAALAAHVRAQRALRVARLTSDQRHREALLGDGVVPAVATLDAQTAVRARLRAAVGVGDPLALVVDVEGERAADAAVRADRVDLPQLLARADRDVVDRLVGQRAGRAGGDALAARHAGRLAHRVVEVEGDARVVALEDAADDVVALDVVARADAAIAEDARVVVDGDDRVGVVLAAAEAARDRRLLLLDAVAAHEDEQLVVGGRDLLRILGDRRLVDEQELGQLRAVALELGRGGLDLHPVLARPDARRRVHAGADVDDAQTTDADRVVPLVVTQDGDLDAGVLGRLPDRRAFRDRQVLPVDRETDGADLGWCGGGDGHGAPRTSCSVDQIGRMHITGRCPSRRSRSGYRRARPRGRAHAPRSTRRSSRRAARA